MAAAFLAAATRASADDQPAWTIFIANDNCPDYTWGFTEEQTRQAFADVVRGHLDEMNRTDAQPSHNRDRYNMAVTHEAICFQERYPERLPELIRRIQENRAYVSPFLCNSLWGFQSFESFVRTLYPARRLEQEWGYKTDCAHHIEEPSLPWGAATILSGCGIRSLTVPFYKYDSTFEQLQNPPIFFHEGPDGSRVRVCMDPWACVKMSYAQGRIATQPERIEKEWLPHYASLGQDYPLRAILASGTHSDISPTKGQEAPRYAKAVIDYSARDDRPARLVNATFSMFWEAVDNSGTDDRFPILRGCFGQSWDVWPVSLARYAADMRDAEQKLLASEALLSIAALREQGLIDATLDLRREADYCLAMLSDHAWNGTDLANKKHNANLRKRWAARLAELAQDLAAQAWKSLSLDQKNTHTITVFNSQSFPRSGLVTIPAPASPARVLHNNRAIPSQTLEQEGKPVLAFLAEEVPAFGFKSFSVDSTQAPPVNPEESSALAATPVALESPFYRLTLDPATGAIRSLLHKPANADLLDPKDPNLAKLSYRDKEDHNLTSATTEVLDNGPVLARLRVTGKLQDIQVTQLITLYAQLDQLDLELLVKKPVRSVEDRLCHLFPLLDEKAQLRVATTGAVVRPYPQPQGDLLPGADTRRLDIQEFLNASTDQLSVTLVPRDAFLLRLDLDRFTIEPVGNDQNFREMIPNQNGESDFRFRYSLRAQAGRYSGSDAYAFSRAILQPLLAVPGQLGDLATTPSLALNINPKRAYATALKPADGPSSSGLILRVQETSGTTGPLNLTTSGFRSARRTDLVERDLADLPITEGKLSLDLKPHGFAAVRLLP